MINKGSRASRWAGVLLIVLLMAMFAPPSVGQTAAPAIAFINPSSFATAGERGIIVSDLPPDAGPGCCRDSEGAYHLSAWVANAPPGSSVFFGVEQRTIDLEITDTTPSANNSWETDWEIPTEILDGPATLFAYLVLNEEVLAFDEQDVTILRVQENLDVVYPESEDGSFGTFAGLANAMPESAPATRKAPVGVIDALWTNTPDFNYVKTFYTTTPPGQEPRWKECGLESIDESNNPETGVRCTLASIADQTAITAVAAVSNDTPHESDYVERFNQSGDAEAVADPYAQSPTSMQFVTEGTQTVQRGSGDQFPCSTAETIEVRDQVGRHIASANIDVHATGPTDSLKFNTMFLLPPNKPPDRGGHAEEEGYDCLAPPPGNANPDMQGEHARFGAPDRKHVESLAGGTNDLGRFSIRFRSNTAGDTQYTMWVDERDDGCGANDDLFTEGELYVDGAIGWGGGSASTNTQPLETFVPCPLAPGPSPSPSIPDAMDGSRSISLRFADRDDVQLGRPARFVGKIAAEDRLCAGNQTVLLKARRPGGRFWTKERTTTDVNGSFSMALKVRAPRDYRAVAPATEVCNRTKSSPLRLRK